MGRLSTDQVLQAASSLTARASSAIDSLEAKKSFVGGWTGNNDTVEQSQGALRMIRDRQIPGWRDNGLTIAQAEDDGRVDGWLSVGQDFAKAIGEIDGYGTDAALDSVVRQTVTQTAADIKTNVLPALSIGLGVTVGLVVLVVIGYVILKTR